MTRKKMPESWEKKVRYFADEARAWTSMRDEAICQLRNEGATLRAIAEAAGLTHTAVAKILDKRGMGANKSA